VKQLKPNLAEGIVFSSIILDGQNYMVPGGIKKIIEKYLEN
jgi:hypothetical protein